MKMDGKIAVVTGAASGIGAALTRRFAAEGAKVVVADLNLDAARAVADKVDGVAVACDVTKESDIQALVAQVLEKDTFFLALRDAQAVTAEIVLDRS